MSIPSFQPSLTFQTKTESPQQARWASEAKPPTNEEWEEQRPLIEQLYQKERRPLLEVVELVNAQKGLKATPRMYRTRMKQWDIRKYRKYPERATARKVLARECVQITGNASRSRLVKGNKYQSFEKSSSTPACANDDGGQSTRTWPYPVLGIDSRTGSPEGVMHLGNLRSLEFMLNNIDIYYTGSFKKGIGGHPEAIKNSYFIYGRSSIHILVNSVMAAQALFSTNDIRGTERTWASVSALLCQVIEEEQGVAWSMLCDLFVRLSRRGWFEVGQELIKQCSRLTANRLGVHHPLFILFRFWSTVSSTDLQHVVAISWQKTCDVLETILGTTHVLTLLSRSFYACRHSQNTDSGKDRIRALMKLVGECEKSRSPLDQDTMQLLVTSVTLVSECGEHAAAVQKAEMIMDRFSTAYFTGALSPHDSGYWHFQYQTYMYAARSCVFLHDEERARLYLEKALELATLWWGRNDIFTITALVWQEQDLNRIGQVNAAAEIRQRRIQAQVERNSILGI